MNIWCGMGRLTKDPIVKYKEGAEPLCVARYTLAIDRPGKDQGADFISCVAFGKRGEFAEKYLKKGTKVSVVGHIQTGSYESNGNKVYTTDIIVDSCEFAESKAAAANETPANVDNSDFMNIPSGADELPFN